MLYLKELERVVEGPAGRSPGRATDTGLGARRRNAGRDRERDHDRKSGGISEQMPWAGRPTVTARAWM